MKAARASALLLMISGAVAADPYLVSDVETVPIVGSSHPVGFHGVAGGAVFVATAKDTGTHLWVTDGTPAGSRILTRLADSGGPLPVEELAVAAGSWYFGFGTDLWRTDGTEEGTLRLGRIGLPPFGQRPTAWVDALGLLFFAAAPSGDPRWLELWRTDGSVSGTRRVRQFSPTGADGGIQSIAALQSEMISSVRSAGGDALWTSDGTSGGTRKVRELEVVAPPLTSDGEQALFFAVQDDAWSLWRSDGTLGGTRSLATMYPASSSGPYRSEVVALGDDFVLLAQDGAGRQLWRTDGTVAGTIRLTSEPGAGLWPGGCFGFPSFGNGTWVVSGDVVYRALGDFDGNCELWRSDGTSEGTRAVEVCAGACGSDPWQVTALGDGRALFFAFGADGIPRPWSVDAAGNAGPLTAVCPAGCLARAVLPFGERALVESSFDPTSSLWITDGTDAGTHLLAEIPESPGITLGEVGAVVGGTVVFAYYDGVLGVEPWRSDGTAAGTSLLLDIVESDTASSNPEFVAGHGDLLYFLAQAGGRRGLWTTDGTSAGTVPALPFDDVFGSGLALVPFRDGAIVEVHASPPEGGLWRLDGGSATRFWDHPFPSISSAIVRNDRFFFADGEALFVSDGTVSGTDELTGARTRVRTYADPQLAELGAHVYFLAAEVDDHGFESGFGLWRTDGTPAGTERVAPVPGASYGSGYLTRFGDRLAFVANDSLGGSTLWSTDGSAVGTNSLGYLGSTPRPIAPAGERLLFSTGSPGDVDTLWTTDGSAGQTSVLLSLRHVEPVNVVGDLAFFVGVDLESRLRIYRSDGTVSGTFAVLESAGYLAGPTVVQDGLLFFVLGVEGESNAAELWRSDGTAAGTFAIRGYDGDPYPARVASPSVVGRRILFWTTTDEGDTALWETDGEAAGTHRVPLPTDVAITTAAGLLQAGARIFFAADDGRHGVEPWALPVEDVVAADPHALGLGEAARFEVEVDWIDYADRRGRASKAPLRVDDSGLFWFFGEDNWELLVKVLDACATDGHFWVFASAATSVGYTLRVTDTATGEVRSYANPVGRPAPPVVDTAAFSTCGVGARAASAPPSVQRSAKGGTACPPGALCLGDDGRFRVSLAWRRFDGQTGIGTPVAGTTESGLFWFFDDDNWEVLVKVLDGCEITGRYWVFAAATTTVELDLRVEDSVTGEVAEYHNPLGQAASAITDTAALDICPGPPARLPDWVRR